METKQEENGVNQHRKGTIMTIMKYTHRQWKLNKRGKWCKSTQKRDDNEIHTQTMETKQEENGVNQHRKGDDNEIHTQTMETKQEENGVNQHRKGDDNEIHTQTMETKQEEEKKRGRNEIQHRKGVNTEIMKYTQRQWKLNKEENV